MRRQKHKKRSNNKCCNSKKAVYLVCFRLLKNFSAFHRVHLWPKVGLNFIEFFKFNNPPLELEETADFDNEEGNGIIITFPKWKLNSLIAL